MRVCVVFAGMAVGGGGDEAGRGGVSPSGPRRRGGTAGLGCWGISPIDLTRRMLASSRALEEAVDIE